MTCGGFRGGVALALGWLAVAGPLHALAQAEPIERRVAAAASFGAVAGRPAPRLAARRPVAAFSALARAPRLRLPRDRGDWSLSTGFELSRGDFGGAQRTRMVYVPLTLRYRGGPWLASLTVPYLRIDGPGDVVSGLDGHLVVGDRARGRSTGRGLGDVVAGLSYAIDPASRALPSLELGVRVKLPTADADEGLGTGKADYTAQLDLAKSLGRLSAFASLGYRVLGDPSGGELDDGFLGSLGFGYRFGSRWSGGISYDAREAATERGSAPRELVPYASYRWSETLSFGSYAVLGLSDASPDLAWGFTARVAW